MPRGKRALSVVDLTTDDISHDHRNKRQAPFQDDGLSYSSQSNSRSADVRESWADATAEVATTQEFDDDELQSFRNYGTVNNKIVGVRYYNGRATPGEFVIIRREPTNPYDSNAIRVDNVMGDQIGKNHIHQGQVNTVSP